MKEEGGTLLGDKGVRRHQVSAGKSQKVLWYENKIQAIPSFNYIFHLKHKRYLIMTLI